MTDGAASEAGRALAKLRPRATYVCKVCGTKFDALVRTSRGTPRAPATCSPKCRQTRYRRARKAASA